MTFCNSKYEYELPGCHGLKTIALKNQSKCKFHAVLMKYFYILENEYRENVA